MSRDANNPFALSQVNVPFALSLSKGEPYP